MQRLRGDGGVDAAQAAVVGMIELAQADRGHSYYYNTGHHETDAKDEEEVMVRIVHCVGAPEDEDDEAEQEDEPAGAHDEVPCTVLLVAVSFVHVSYVPFGAPEAELDLEIWSTRPTQVVVLRLLPSWWGSAHYDNCSSLKARCSHCCDQQ